MRRHVDWFQILNEINNPVMMDRFFVLFRKLRKGKSMSERRCAYNVLKDYYSTTTIDELCEKLGI